MRLQPRSALLCFFVASCADVAAPLDQPFAGERSGDSPSPLTNQDAAAAVDLDGASSGAQLPEAGAPLGSASGLPCDVQQLLATYCIACHKAPPVGNAPMALTTYAELMTPRPGTTKTAAELAVAAMKSSGAPMPPAGPRPSATQIAAFEAWLTSGAPQADCASGPLGDASAANDIYATPLVCTSGNTWNGDEGEKMRPGEACISCHKQEREGPLFAVAGTVYPTAHEPDSCDGSSAQATVEITDKNGVKRTVTANEVGNFFFEGTLALPYTATVTYQGRTRVMATPQSVGDCNSCHTQDGSNGAPGRVLLP